MKRASTKQGRRLVLLGAAVLLLIAAQAWLWSWVHAQALEFHRRRSHDEQLSQLSARVGLIREALAGQQASLDELSAVAPREQGVVQVIETLETLAASLGIALDVEALSDAESVDVLPADQPAVLAPLTLTLQAAGEPAGLLAFVDAVERLSYLTRVAQLRLEPSAEAARLPGKFTLFLDVVFFVQPNL